MPPPVPAGGDSTRLGGRYAVPGASADLSPGLYSAVDLVLQRRVDVAVLPPRAPAEESELRAWIARWVAVGHPALLTVYDSGQQDGSAFLVLPASGGVLAASVAAAGPVPVALAVDWVRHLLTGLRALHDARAVHGTIDATAVVVVEDRALLLPVSLDQVHGRASPGAGHSAGSAGTTPGQDVSAVVHLLAHLVLGRRASGQDLLGDPQLASALAEGGTAGAAAGSLIESETRLPGLLDAHWALGLVEQTHEGVPGEERAVPDPASTPPPDLQRDDQREQREQREPADPSRSRRPPARPGSPAGTRRRASGARVGRSDWPPRRRALLVVTLACAGALLGLLLFAALT